MRRPVDGQRPLGLAICSAGELYGGVEQFIYTFATELVKDRSVRLIVVLFNEGLLSSRLKEAGVRTFVLASRKYSPLAVGRLARLFREEGVEIVHSNGYKANILCGMAAKACGARIVKTEHGMIEPSGFFKGTRMRLNILVDRAVTRALADRVVFVSRDIQAHCGPGVNGRGAVIYNGICPIEGAAADVASRERGTFEIGVIGRLSRVKGHIFLLEAMRLLDGVKDLRLNIYGSGDIEKELKDFTALHSLSERVVFHGFRTDIHECMRALDLLVMPSLHEGLPYTLLEAMYLKVPVLASDVGGLREILENNGDAMLVPPGDAHALARAIGLLHKDPAMRKALASKAFEKVIGNYLIDGMARKYMEVYLG